MRADQRGTESPFASARLREFHGEIMFHARLIFYAQFLRVARNAPMREPRERGKFGCKPTPDANEVVAELHELGGKAFQRSLVCGAMLKQGISRPHGVHVTLEQRQIARLRLSQQQVNKPPPRPRRALDQLQILRAKNHRPQRAEIIRQFLHRLAVECEFPFTQRPIHFDFAFTLPDDFSADKISFRAVPDHLRAADAAKGPQRGQQINRFQNVCFALRVVAEQQMKAWRKIHVQPRVIAEVSES